MRVRWIGFGCALLASIGGYGQRQDAHVPQALQDWQDWVLHGQEHRNCPFLYDSGAEAREDFVCAWPGQLHIEVAAESGRFEQTWTIYGDQQWVPLPGDAKVWPRDVTTDGDATEVILRQGAPAIRLAPGRYRVDGAFAWGERPAALAVPFQSGLFDLVVDGKRISLPRRRAGNVWLGDGEGSERVEDALRVVVHRRIEDEVPTRLETVIQFDVSGSVREERFGPALPDGFVPLSLNSELTARLEADGDLRVQVRPGAWNIVVHARARGVLASVAMPTPERNLPAAEIWSYQANPKLRATLAEASRPVSPAQVGTPWLDLPAFRMAPGESLAIVERSRGKAKTDHDLHVHRQLWLDFDGSGFVFADKISGVMRADWRLDMAAPYSLGSATELGRDLLVTRSEAQDDNSAGIEVRLANLDIDALGRIDTRGEMPATGWLAGLDQMTATLNLPPGYKLLAALGVDHASSSWAGRWRLLDFFLLMVATVATARLFGRAAGAVALVALTLSFHESGAPVWTWLNLLAAVALARVAPPGRLLRAARGYRMASFAVLLLFLVPFVIGQIRIAVYPQLEPDTSRRGQTFGLFEMLAGEMRTPLRSAADTIFAEKSEAAKPDETVMAEASRMGLSAPAYARYDENALVQTGPGRPYWIWTSHRLSFSGPVDAGRTMQLVILPDRLVSVLRFIAGATLGVFAALFAFDILGRTWRWPTLKRMRTGTGAAAVALLAVLLDAQPTVHADTPSPKILNELEQRLLKPLACVPRCAEIVHADVEAGVDEVTMNLALHALAEVAVPMPGTADGWRPEAISIGGNELAAHRDRKGVLWVRLDAGRHALTLRGPMPPGDTVEIPFAAAPRSISAKSEHWFITGIEDRVLAAGALSLTRLGRDVEDGTARSWEASRFPAFVRIERTFDLDLDWHVATSVHRIAPRTGAITINVPLRAQESIIDRELAVANGSVTVSMDPTQQTYSWYSSLPRQASLTLHADTDRPWQEVWRFKVGSVWAARFDGVPESQPNRSGDASSVLVREFHPRPGETLAVAIARPEAVDGSTLAFDQVTLDTTVGIHLRSSRMALRYRSTRGDSHRIGLPAAARVTSVTIDGRSEPITERGGQLDLPILPGTHTIEVAWNEAAVPGFLVRTPNVELGVPSSNIVSALEMPTSRWLLFATGPSLGPAILYWSELIALIAAAVLLGRFEPTPLRTSHWLLLGLGFSTFSWFALGVVVVWLLAHGTRKSWGAKLTPRVHNLSQVALAVLTLAAFSAILVGIPSGLLGNPDMHVTGFGAGRHQLRWFADQTNAAIPEASVWSLPLWTYKALILAWALWLSFFGLVRWLPWVWQCFVGQGLWHRTESSKEAEAA